MAFWNRKRRKKVDDAIEAVLDGEARQIEAFEEMLEHRPTAVADGVDISAITAADPTFDDQEFVAIARECFFHIRQARTAGDTALALGLLSAQLLSEVKEAIDGDVASHRHHLLPGLELQSAVITSADVVDGKFQITVQLHVWSAQADVDDTGAVVAGSFVGHEWDEDWTFWRDPTINASATDLDHTLRRGAEGGWMFAHKGWIVTAIERAGVDAAAG